MTLARQSTLKLCLNSAACGLAGLAMVTMVAGCGGLGDSSGQAAGGGSVNEGDDVERTVGAIVGPGLGNLTYTSGELNKMVSAIIDDPGARGGHGNVAMVNGYLATIYTFDGGGSNASFAFWNVSNPRSPVRAFNYDRPAGSKLREAHGWGLTNGYSGKTYAFAQSTTGFQIWDWTDPAAATLVRDVIVPNVDATDYGGAWWVHVQAPYVYVAGGTAGLFVYDAANPATTAPVLVKSLTNAQLGIARVNQVHVIGNLMIVNYVENGSGMSLLDISDPANPTVKFTDANNPSTPYSTTFNGGKLAAAGKLTLKMSMYNILFDANQMPSGISRYGVDSGTGLSGGGYITFQDGFAMGGFSNAFAKFDARTTALTQVGSGAPPAPYNGDLDFATALGNLVFVGNDHGDGSALMVQQLAPDTTGPSVNFVNPANGSVNRNVKSRVGLTFTDAVDLRTLTTTNIIVRPVGGSALAGRFSTQAGVVNFFPTTALAANTTYEVLVPTGGVSDYVGNKVPVQFLSRFSTGTTIVAGPAGCDIGVDAPKLVGSGTTLTATGCSGNGLTFSWQLGDGTTTAFSSSPSTTYTYSAPSHYVVILTAKDSGGLTATWSRRQTITYPATANKPTSSSTIVTDATRGRVSVVNSDGNTAASLDVVSPFTKRWEVNVGRNPRSLAQPVAGGDLWVVSQDDATISVLDGGTGATKFTITLPQASRPHGLAFNPAGSLAYVTLEGTGRLLRIAVSSRLVTGDIDVGPKPRGVAVSSDGARILVSRLVSPNGGGEVREVNGSSFAVTRTFVLPLDTTTASSEADGPGLPNYVQSVSITPDGRGAWVPSKKDNIRRGTGPTSDGIPFTQDSRLRTMVSKLDLIGNTVEVPKRRDINDGDLANAVAFNALGDYAFVATQGGNRLEFYDALSHNSIASIGGVGLAPRGLVVSGNLLFVQNFMSRDMSVIDVSTVGGTNVFTKVATVSTQAVERLPAQVLQGKRVFYNAADTRMALQSYTSCASCHLDGDNDGRVWDFTQFGEGVRATSSLLGRGGVGEGPVHWTGNFDEIQDFENDIRGPAFGGSGFMTNADFTATSDPLGAPKAGRSPDLDALAAYLTSLTDVPPSPFRGPDGGMTAAALAGKALFESSAVGCATCHSGAEQTDSALGVFHDVGTKTAASGQRIGQPLTGFDTPTTVGVWSTGPYLHDGSAATLLDVITVKNAGDRHGVTSQLTATEQSQLVAYLQELDERPPVAVPPSAPTGVSALAGNAQVTVSWTAVSGAQSYTVKRSTTAGGPYSIAQAGIVGTAFTVTGLTNGVTSFFVVTATGPTGESAASAEVSATPIAPPPPPAAPTGVTATAGNGQVTVSWLAVSGATSYTVKRGTTNGGPYGTIVASGITTTSTINTGLTAGTTYYYVVTASNANGEGPASAQVSAIPTTSWITQDVGTVTATGSWSQASGLHTVRGSGADIWDVADGFRFVYQNISGNATITARVASVQNVNNWTKAGVMMRNGLTPGAANMYMFTTPASINGHRMQDRDAANGTTLSTAATGSGTAPVWVRIVRSGSNFTASVSTNGTTFTQVGTTRTIAMSTSITVGLAVTSHTTNATLATATFDNVTVTTP